MKKSLFTSATALVAGVAIALAAPLAASAHVGIDPNQSDPGTYPLITFKVPTESATATTTKIELTLPQDTPFGFVSYTPVEGWATELVKETLPEPVVTDDGEVTEAVTKVIWTAEPGSELTAEQYGLFPLVLGPVPDTGSVVLAVDQTYSDGTVVSWSETGADAEFPAPVLYVNDVPESDHHAGGGADDEHAEIVVDGDTAAAASGDTLARVLGIGGLVLGAVAVVIALTSHRKKDA
ncbi:MAG: YcnI family protein [Actinobacteria bacterium]|nr:YcnI family protein [Actinomycetota bacterium]